MKPCERFSGDLYLWLAEPQLEAAFCQQSNSITIQQWVGIHDFTFQASNWILWHYHMSQLADELINFTGNNFLLMPGEKFSPKRTPHVWSTLWDLPALAACSSWCNMTPALGRGARSLAIYSLPPNICSWVGQKTWGQGEQRTAYTNDDITVGPAPIHLVYIISYLTVSQKKTL